MHMWPAPVDRALLFAHGREGIGKAMVEKLAKQGINVVLVALDDDMLKNTFDEMYDPRAAFAPWAANPNRGLTRDRRDFACRHVPPPLLPHP